MAYEESRPAKKPNRPPRREHLGALVQIKDLDNIKDILKSQPFPLTSLDFRWEEVWAIPLEKGYFLAFKESKKLERLKSYSTSKLGRQIEVYRNILGPLEFKNIKKWLRNVGFKIFYDFPHSW